jgi:hypothetical protein
MLRARRDGKILDTDIASTGFWEETTDKRAIKQFIKEVNDSPQPTFTFVPDVELLRYLAGKMYKDEANKPWVEEIDCEQRENITEIETQSVALAQETEPVDYSCYFSVTKDVKNEKMTKAGKDKAENDAMNTIKNNLKKLGAQENQMMKAMVAVGESLSLSLSLSLQKIKLWLRRLSLNVAVCVVVCCVRVLLCAVYTQVFACDNERERPRREATGSMGRQRPACVQKGRTIQLYFVCI